jgi:hypothetical protein
VTVTDEQAVMLAALGAARLLREAPRAPVVEPEAQAPAPVTPQAPTAPEVPPAPQAQAPVPQAQAPVPKRRGRPPKVRPQGDT